MDRFEPNLQSGAVVLSVLPVAFLGAVFGVGPLVIGTNLVMRDDDFTDRAAIGVAFLAVGAIIALGLPALALRGAGRWPSAFDAAGVHLRNGRVLAWSAFQQVQKVNWTKYGRVTRVSYNMLFTGYGRLYVPHQRYVDPVTFERFLAALSNGHVPWARPGAFAPGARVSVVWSDGARYPGVVQTPGPQGCVVAFPNGRAEWVPTEKIVAM
jgi:hypothetical protein